MKMLLPRGKGHQFLVAFFSNTFPYREAEVN